MTGLSQFLSFYQMLLFAALFEKFEIGKEHNVFPVNAEWIYM